MRTIQVKDVCGLQTAIEEAKQWEKESGGVRIELADGMYEQHKPLVIKNMHIEDGLQLTAKQGATPVINGMISLQAEDFIRENDYFVYQFQADSEGKMPVFHDFYDDGKKIPLCRSRYTRLQEHFEDGQDPKQLQGLYVEEELIKEVAFPAEFHIYFEWEYHMIHAIGAEKENTVIQDGKTYVLVKFKQDELEDLFRFQHPSLSLEKRLVFFGNHPAMLQEGTWAYDLEQGKLYYAPEQGVVKAPAYSVTKTLIQITNSSNVHMEGLHFTGTGCIEPAEYGYFSGQANTEYRYGVMPCSAVLLQDTEHISIKGCVFEELGSNGVQSLETLRGLSVRECKFFNIAMSAIVVGNRRGPWKALPCSHDCEILYNEICGIGMEFPTCPGIVFAKIDGLKILHNTIRNVAYSGISLGWSWGVARFELDEDANIKDVEIAYNWIEDFMKLLRDGGAIYVVGGNSKITYTKLFNSMHDNVAIRPLDTEEQNCSRGYYLDQAASNWHVYQNIIAGAIRPLFVQYVILTQPCYNNLVQNTYSTTPISEQNHAPERNIIVQDSYVEADLDTLLKKYPQARTIYENAGCVL